MAFGGLWALLYALDWLKGRKKKHVTLKPPIPLDPDFLAEELEAVNKQQIETLRWLESQPAQQFPRRYVEPPGDLDDSGDPKVP
jgi:hypothetical protein